MENRIKKVMSEVLSLNIENISESTSPEKVESWDSLKHINLIIALEEEFDIEFSDSDIETLLNYKLITITIREILNK